MLRSLLAFLSCALLALAPTQAPAQAAGAPVIAEMASAVRDARLAQEARVGSGAIAAQELRRRFEAAGVDYSLRFVAPWGNWTHGDWLSAVGLYQRAEQHLLGWYAEVNAGRISEADALAILEERMVLFHLLDDMVTGGFDDLFAANVASARMTDLKVTYPSCDGLYAHYDRAADLAFDTMVDVNWSWVGGLNVIPPPGGGGGGAGPEIAARVAEMTPHGPVHRRAAEAHRLLTELTLEGLAPEDELSVLLRVERDRLSSQTTDLEGLLEDIRGTEDPDLRRAMLDAAQDAIWQRAGQLALEVMGATLQGGGDAEALSDFLLQTRRMIARSRDAGLDTGLPGLQRGMAGLHFAAELAEASGETPTANELRAMIDSFSAAATGAGRITGPFAAQFGAVTAQLGQTREAWDAAGDAMDGVVRMIEGDDAAFADVQAASDRIQRALDPKTVIRAMTDGALSAVDGLIPGSRGWITDAFRSLFS